MPLLRQSLREDRRHPAAVPSRYAPGFVVSSFRWRLVASALSRYRSSHARTAVAFDADILKVAIANFSNRVHASYDFVEYWNRYEKPPGPPRLSIMEQPHDWGFHIFAIAAYMLDRGLADQAEFWDYRDDRLDSYHPTGVHRVSFFNEADLKCYLDRFGYPDLFINYGYVGHPILDFLAGKSFRVHVPCIRKGKHLLGNFDAECFLVDAPQYLDARSMLYVPVVHTGKIFPTECEKVRDFIYLASAYPGKRHDLLLRSVKGRNVTGHLHPVDASALDLTGTLLTTSNWYEREVAELLRTSRIAVYPADHTSNPAAMWECVAAGLPIVMNENIEGGKHLVIPGVTGELASEEGFGAAIERVLADRHSYRASEYFQSHWNTLEMLDRYLEFFQTMGLKI